MGWRVKSQPMFRRNMLLTSSESKNKWSKKPAWSKQQGVPRILTTYLPELWKPHILYVLDLTGPQWKPGNGFRVINLHVLWHVCNFSIGYKTTIFSIINIFFLLTKYLILLRGLLGLLPTKIFMNILIPPVRQNGKRTAHFAFLYLFALKILSLTVMKSRVWMGYWI
jgi:hypothetical protein